MRQLAPKLYSWASILDDNTRLQAEAIARMPFVYPHVAQMPDAHFGKGAPVGTVIPTLEAIIPAAVGVDIGCGMRAVRTQFTVDDINWRIKASPLAALRLTIEKVIPSSMGNYNSGPYNAGTRERWRTLENMAGVEQADSVTARRPVTHIPGKNQGWQMQLGSLGGGNHFIEVSYDEMGAVWLFLHSGSRGVGNKLAMRHIKVAQDQCKADGVKLENQDLAYLEEGAEEFDSYIEALNWAQTFARLNREEMMERLANEFGLWMGEAVVPQETIQCHHNYTVPSWYNGTKIWLSRKGAIDASFRTPGLIPGSMGAASYVVEGKGNTMSLDSAPHGAGRVRSRGAAKRELSFDDLAATMKAQNIEWSGSEAFLDEAPDAYKPIDQVMADSADLVTIEHELHQLVNVKGV
jgi:tRNA-splicing ligase RtcB (3'-phosphate/5'-hydroxy nucleic acid ligase)